MKLTKSERHTAYIIMLAEVEKTVLSSGVGFCHLCEKLWSIDLDNNGWFANFQKIFPELFDKRCNSVMGCYLFDNWQQRKEALKQCIIETY